MAADKEVTLKGNSMLMLMVISDSKDLFPTTW